MEDREREELKPREGLNAEGELNIAFVRLLTLTNERREKGRGKKQKRER